MHIDPPLPPGPPPSELTSRPAEPSFGTITISGAVAKRTIDHNDDMLNLLGQGIERLLQSGTLDVVENLGYLALMLDPLDPRSDYWCGLGMEHNGNLEHARLAFETAIQKAPGFAAAHTALGALLLRAGEIDKASEHFQIALAGDPSQVRALQGFMLCRLTRGDLQRGWQLYRHRTRVKVVDRIIQKYPANFKWWDGVTPGHVLMIGEEGYGERLMFSSMVPDAIARGAKPIIELIGEAAKFTPLFKRSFPDCVIGEENSTHPCNFKLNIGDLGGFYRRSFDDFPKHTGYLKADAKRVAEYRKRLGPGPIVGISWKSEGPSGPFKSIPLELFNAMFRNYRITFVDLQYGQTEAERHRAAPLLNHLPDVDLTDDIDSMAALTAACDLVITISNLTAHIAGGLGVPVWMLAPQSRGLMWFWFQDRDDSPWYPSMKIWRQPEAGWPALLNDVAMALNAREWPQWKTDNAV